MTREIDFKGYLDKNLSKSFKFENDDSTNYDFTDTDNVVFKLYKDILNPLIISGTLSVSISTVEFLLLNTIHTDELGTWEYIIEDNKSNGDIIQIGKGNFEIQEYTSFSVSIASYIRTELPLNIDLTNDFKNQRLFYWRTILQSAFNITDSDINIESAWPHLVNALFAKLIVHDAIEQASKGSYIQFLGGSDSTVSTNTTPSGIKKIETGPTSIEYQDLSTYIKNAFSSSTGNITFFESLKQSLCGLSNYLKVKLPMCKGNNITIPPKFYKNPDWDYTTLTDIVEIVTVQSQG